MLLSGGKCTNKTVKKQIPGEEDEMDGMDEENMDVMDEMDKIRVQERKNGGLCPSTPLSP
jgi:hypothetical protein